MSRLAYAKVAPQAIHAILGVKQYTDGGSIDHRLRALIELRVSQINGCAFCVDMHSQEARKAGETQQRLDCLCAWREAPLFSEREKAALSWAETVTLVSQTGIPDAEFEHLRRELSDKEIVDLTVIVGMINVWNRIAIGFRQSPVARNEVSAAE
ncbi:MAG: carboxymuconolactone decarboxylase family protein [Planctomycetes bacterium]|nr:carboxymuconolactone decarboxylase family protein [Planctomycetota bacterium]